MAERSIRSAGSELKEQDVARVVAAARERAAELSVSVTVAVVDVQELRALLRMDGADRLTVGLACGKARSAAANGMPTARWRQIFADDPHLGMTLPVVLDRLLSGAVLLGGGHPLRDSGRVIGAVGVSGAAEDQDEAISAAAAAAHRRSDDGDAG